MSKVGPSTVYVHKALWKGQTGPEKRDLRAVLRKRSPAICTTVLPDQMLLFLHSLHPPECKLVTG